MSRRAYIDVLLEIPAHELHNQPDPTRYLWERMRTKADAECEAAGARLYTDSTPEVVIRQAHSALIGDITLVATRWPVDVPDRVSATL